jgi:hypothetical protein
METKVDNLERENQELRARYKKYDELLSKVADQLGL